MDRDQIINGIEAAIIVIVLFLVVLAITFLGKSDVTSRFHKTDERSLIFDTETNVLYYGDGFVPICPYYTRDGNMALYIDGDIVEIKEYEAED